MGDEEGEVESGYQVIFDDEPTKSYPYLPPRDGKATGFPRFPFAFY